MRRHFFRKNAYFRKNQDHFKKILEKFCNFLIKITHFMHISAKIAIAKIAKINNSSIKSI